MLAVSVARALSWVGVLACFLLAVSISAVSLFASVPAAPQPGALWAWGANDLGQLGIGTDELNSPLPRLGGLEQVTVVAAGRRHALAVRKDGSLWAWGWNSDGQLGNGATLAVGTFSAVQVDGLGKVVAVAAGEAHSLALGEDGALWAWGNNFWGQLGTGATNGYLAGPTRVQMGDLQGIT